MTLLKAKAKINLFFHITGKRDDGYHLIESLVAFADDVYDSIEISPSTINSTKVIGGEFAESLLNEKNNLIDKALNSFTTNQKYTCYLTKNIPIGAGLGGGSADAAIIARFLTHLPRALSSIKTHLSSLTRGFSPEIGDLLRFSSRDPRSPLRSARDDERVVEDMVINNKLTEIGADLPICYFQQPTYCSGIGEILEPIKDFPKLYIVLVNPRKELLTKDVFIANKKINSPPIIHKPLFLSNSTDKLIDFLKNTDNVLTEAAAEMVPEINKILQILDEQHGCKIARMSGSGPTCFGIFTERTQAMLAKEEISKAYPEFWVKYSTI